MGRPTIARRIAQIRHRRASEDEDREQEMAQDARSQMLQRLHRLHSQRRARRLLARGGEHGHP